jgi:hypothetical protein
MNNDEPKLMTIDPATTAVVRDVIPIAALRDFSPSPHRRWIRATRVPN